MQASAAAALAAKREDCIVLSMTHIVWYWVCITCSETLSLAFSPVICLSPVFQLCKNIPGSFFYNIICHLLVWFISAFTQFHHNLCNLQCTSPSATGIISACFSKDVKMSFFNILPQTARILSHTIHFATCNLLCIECVCVCMCYYTYYVRLWIRDWCVCVV